jgi:hypothetical protein
VSAASDLEAVATQLDQFPEQAVRHAVTELRRAILPRLRRDTGGDQRLSGMRSGARLDVTAETKGSGGQVAAGPRRMLGPWRWLNNGTRPRAQGRGRHPGTRPKGTWDQATAKALPDVERDVAALFDQVVG